MEINRSPGNSTTSRVPESAHSLSVARRSVSRRLRGMVLMAMVFLPVYDQLVSDLPPNHHKVDDIALNIVQHAQVADAQLEFGDRIRPKPLDGFGRHRRP